MKITILIGILWLCFDGFYAYLTWNLPETHVPFLQSPAFFPYILVFLLGLLSTVYLVQSFFSSSKQTVTLKGLREADWGKVLKIVLVATTITSYGACLFLLPFGFKITTFFFLIMLMLILGSKNWVQILWISVGATLLCDIVFRALFNVPLPELPLLQWML